MTQLEALRVQYTQHLETAAYLKEQAAEEMRRRHKEEDESVSQLCREWGTKDRRTILNMLKPW